jgi:hypothetical protein
MGGDLAYHRRDDWSVFEMTLPTAAAQTGRSHLRVVETAAG